MFSSLDKHSKNLLHSPSFREFVRFAIVGTVATAIHYGIYLLLLWLCHIKQTETVWVEAAYSAGYIVSFLCNLWLTAHFTFRKTLNVKRGGGFVLSHIVNYLLHIGILTLFLRLGVPKAWAPVPVFCIAVPVNFLLVRFVFKSKYFEK